MTKKRPSAHLDSISPNLDLAPRHSLIRPRPGIAPVKLLPRVDVNSRLGAVAHQTRIRNMVLDHPPSQNDHTRPLGPYRQRIDLANILDNIHPQLRRRRLERVKVQHIPQTPIRQRRAEHRDVVLPRPVVHRPLVVDLLAQPVNHLARRPAELGVGPARRLLLGEHRVEDRHHPVLEGAVVGVGHDEVADAVEALGAQGGAGGVEGGEVGRPEAFDQVFFDAAGRGDDGRDVPVLDEVAEGAAEAGGDEVGGVAEEDGGFFVGGWVSPGALGGVSVWWGGEGRLWCEADHVVDDADGLAHGRGLEAHVLHALVEVVDGDGPAGELVEVELLDLLGVGRHLDRLDEDGLGGGRGGLFMGLGCHFEMVV